MSADYERLERRHRYLGFHTEAPAVREWVADVLAALRAAELRVSESREDGDGRRTGGEALALRQRDDWRRRAVELGDDVQALRDALLEMMDEFRGQTTRYSQAFDKGDGWRSALRALAKSDLKPDAPTASESTASEATNASHAVWCGTRSGRNCSCILAPEATPADTSPRLTRALNAILSMGEAAPAVAPPQECEDCDGDGYYQHYMHGTTMCRTCDGLGTAPPPARAPSGAPQGDEAMLAARRSWARTLPREPHYTDAFEAGFHAALSLAPQGDGSLTFAALREANIARLPQFKNRKGEPAHSEPDGSDWALSAWSNAVLGELGEAANLIKKIERGDMTLDEARGELAKEFADVQTYLDILAFRAGIDLGSATVAKWNEVSERVGCDLRLRAALSLQGAPAPRVKDAANHIQGLEREVESLRCQLAHQGDMLRGDYWFWQGDGEDHLESLACPVVIRPEELAALLAIGGKVQDAVDAALAAPEGPPNPSETPNGSAEGQGEREAVRERMAKLVDAAYDLDAAFVTIPTTVAQEIVDALSTSPAAQEERETFFRIQDAIDHATEDHDIPLATIEAATHAVMDALRALSTEQKED
jgi:NTP pyrophosphatase (non-canonical NTP hydrolase)